jgi:glyoxylase-like metal-dependent hydrolase (beta-lactamase superfamily II)
MYRREPHTGCRLTRRHRWSCRLHRPLLLAIAASACVLALAQPARPQLQPVADGVYLAQGLSALGASENRNFISNATVVLTERSVVVVDALGSPALAEELLAEIRRLTPLPVSHVIVTHYHADHIYGLQVFQAAGASIVAHPKALEYLNSDGAARRLEASREEFAPWVDARTRLVAADRWVDQPTVLNVGGLELHLRPAGPAHTPEDLVVWLPQRRTLIAGDLVFRGRIPFVGQADSGQWIAALDLLLAYDAQTIVPGHGPVSRLARQDLQLTRDYLAYLRQTMGEAARNLEPFDEAYARTDWSRFAHLPLFGVANRINAYNTYLLMERAP